MHSTIPKSEEIWKEIKEFSECYVSNRGRVRSKFKFLKTSLSHGYRVVYLWNYKTRKKAMIYKHRIIAEAFIPNPGNLPHVDHIDRNKLNNNIWNLRWVTPSENIMNSKIRTDNTSGINGIRWYERYKKWHAQICIAQKNIHIGYFVNLEDAIKERQKIEDNFWKEFNDKNKI